MNQVTKLLLFSLAVVLVSCQQRELNTQISHTTGWNYYDVNTTNFQAKEGVGNVHPTGMVAIQGGKFTIGEHDEFLTAPRDNANRKLTVSSFYMDKYEVTNMDWNEYLHWLNTVFGDVDTSLVNRAKPDHTVWRSEMAYNDPYERNYFTHPAFAFYPIVGVTWEQAMAYCQWRTDRVNELALIQAGAMAWPDFQQLRWMEMDEDEAMEYQLELNNGVEGDENQKYVLIKKEQASPEDPEEIETFYHLPYNYIRDQFVFNTEKYLETSNEEYFPRIDNERKALRNSLGDLRKADISDGIMVTGYRLPTEAEWEFAAYAPIAGEDGLTIEGKIYPWSGYHPRDLRKENLGQMQANFVRGRGDMMGVSGALNDRYVVTNAVDEFAPNDFGLYNMAGNVNEWVMDVYRETTNEETSEYNPYRGNIYSKPQRNSDGTYIMDEYGRLAIEWDSREDDKRNYKDGDYASLIKTDFPLDTTGYASLLGTDKAIRLDPTDALAPRIDNESRVYKGGSWADRVYWLNPSTRRWLNQKKCSATIGFRCAMSTLGDQIPTKIK